MAGRPRTPTNVLKLRGAEKNHPERLKERENEPVNKNPIGTPPRYLNAIEKKAFKLIVKESIDGVLGEADRMAVAQAAILFVICTNQCFTEAVGTEGDEDYEPPKLVRPKSADQQLFFKYLAQFGMTPADRSKLSLPGQKPKNRFEDD